MVHEIRSQQAEILVNRNIKAYILLNLDLLVMLVPVIMILWVKIGLTFNQVLLLQGIFVLTIMVAEVPSGALADSRRRKSVVIIGQSLIACATAFYLVADNFWWCVMAEMTYGLGQATLSGSLQAMLYDSLLEYSRQDELQSVVRTERIITFTLAVLLAPVGGIMGTIAVRLPLLVITVLEVVIVLLSVFLLTEPERVKARNTGEAAVRAIKGLKNPVLFGLAIFSLSGAVGTIVFWSYQNLFVNEFNFTALTMGVLMAILNLLAASSTWFSRKLEKKVSLNLLTCFAALDTVGIVMIVLFKNSVAVFLPVLLFQFTRGSKAPLVAVLMQENLHSAERATYISLNSMIGSLVYMLLVGTVNGLGLSLVETLVLMAVSCAVITLSLVATVTIPMLKNGRKLVKNRYESKLRQLTARVES
ncbi:MAG: MFS transporter [Candidatus Odinarchaeota archaeon]